LTHENLQLAFYFNVHGPFAAVAAVLPDMQARRSATILFTTGAMSVNPHMGGRIFEIYANFAISGAALRSYAHALHIALAQSGIQVGHVAIGAWIGKQPGQRLKRLLRCTGNSIHNETRSKRFSFQRQPASSCQPAALFINRQHPKLNK
jgi:NAD(P)-dependent dehydrogenase (short-subunit alcohol dehydrogenase family)